MECILVVANAGAGGYEAEQRRTAVATLRRDFEVMVAETSTPDELDDALAGYPGQIVVAAGGDGTLHVVVNALHRHGMLGTVRLGLVPLGTGNDFARGAGIPLDLERSTALVAGGHTREVDLIVDDAGLVTVNNAHLGVGVQAARAAQRWKPRLGRLGYAVGALIAGLRPKYPRVRVSLDGRDLARGRRVAQVAIGNGSRVGGGTELIPGAHPSTGQVRVIVSRPRGWWRRVTYLARLRGGTHHQMTEVERADGREVTVTGEPFWVVADGEIDGPHRRRTWRIAPGAVRMFLPEP